jgi:hypothetical protein
MDIFQHMLVMDTIRGEDSTGVFAVDRRGSVGIMKVGSHPMHLFACDDWKKFKSKVFSQGRIIIGHNRKATMGTINSKNAHPFHENNIVLVHNGTLRGDHKKLADTEVDSHAVCHAFNEKGAEEVIPTINGAFAFVWYDLAKGKLFAIRNDERPLSLILTERTIAIASEAWMPMSMYMRDRQKIQQTIECEPGVLYEFDSKGGYSTKKLNLHQPQTYTSGRTVNQAHCTPGTGCGGNEGDFDNENFHKAWGIEKPSPKQLPVVVEKEKSSESAISKIATLYNKEDPEFPKNSEVMLKLVEGSLERGENGRQVAKLRGKVITPDKSEIDAVGYMGVADGSQLHLELLEAKAVIATVMSVSNASVCGRSLWVKDFKLAPMKSIYNGETAFWNKVVMDEKCHDCGANIFDEEAAVTVVTQRSPNNRLKVVCCDCMEDKLKGELKDEFIARRNSAVQNAVRVSTTDDLPDVGADPKAGTPTLH